MTGPLQPEAASELGLRQSQVLIRDYAAFVRETDLGKGKPTERFDIALYGLVGEIGSLVSAIKKRLLASGRKYWSVPNDEIIEELGDSLWYCFAIAAASDLDTAFVVADVRLLQNEVGGEDKRAERIRSVLGSKAGLFLEAAPVFLQDLADGAASLEDFRRLAFLTSRTRDDELVEVCLAVLQQLTAELLRRKLPELEKELNISLPDRQLELVLAEVLWHVAALASLYKLNLNDVAQVNMAKLTRRFRRGQPTPLPDDGRPTDEKLPRRFEVAFVPVAQGRARMYVGGLRLGNDLTDNAYHDDGYRFHDVMHLALASTLGWSPVLRKLMNRKRRRDPATDEVEDGARAAIVEEAVINAIYAEGVRVAALAASGASHGPVRLFSDASDMSFAFLKRLESLVTGLEVQKSNYWEWEDAILSGFEIFNQLRTYDRGTVTVDLEQRTLDFVPSVFLDLQGQVAGIGVSKGKLEDASPHGLNGKEQGEVIGSFGWSGGLAVKKAVLMALGLSQAFSDELSICGWRNGILDVRPTGHACEVMWAKNVVTFRATAIEEDDLSSIIVLAISDA